MTARIKETYAKEMVPRLMKERSYTNVMAVPRAPQDRGQHGRGRGHPEHQAPGRGHGRARPHHRPAAGHAPLARSRSPPSAAPGHAHRGHRDPARRPHVRVRATASSTWPCPACATSAACPRTRSTAAATTPWASRTRSSSPRSTTPRWTSSAGMNVTFVTTARTDEESQAPPPVPRHAVPESVEEARSGQDVAHCQGPADAEVRGAQVHPLPHVRPSPRLPEEVRALPHLLPASLPSPGTSPA